MCEVSLVVALALLQCNSTTSRFLSYTTMKTDVSTQQLKQTSPRNNVNRDVTMEKLRLTDELGQRMSRGWTEAREFIRWTVKTFDRRGW
jgi:hypothetical protein